MQRYHAGSCTSAVNNSAISGIQVRDTSRTDSSVVPPNFSLNSRRSSQPTPYNLRCDKEQLNSRLGPPDFHPQTSSCPEETLTREYVQSGYRETAEGLEEAREISLSHVQAFTKPSIGKYKEAIRKCHRAINESRAQKRKAGQVYGVPLSGALLTKPGIFPEQRPCGEDFRKKWIECVPFNLGLPNYHVVNETNGLIKAVHKQLTFLLSKLSYINQGLSQPHKRLRSLTDHVPHVYRSKSLFEVLIRNNVPLLRATWFVKVTYLNQIHAASSNSSSKSHEKTQYSLSQQWTKDVIEYLQYLLDELLKKNSSRSTLHMRGRSSQMVYAGSVQQKGDSFLPIMDGEEPSLYTKWWYVVRIIHWHHAEGLVVPSLIIDWVLNQLQVLRHEIMSLQEKESLSVLQLLLPIIYGVIETVVSCQTYVRALAGLAVRFIQEPYPGGSDLADNSRHAFTTSAVVEMLRYLIQAVPDTFVALDCFPLPKCVISHVVNDGSFLSKMAEDARKLKDGQIEVAGVLRDKNHEVQGDSLSFQRVVSSIQTRRETLSRAASLNHPGHDVAKALQVLDQALVHGDVRAAYKLLLENTWYGVCAERWSAEVSPCLRTSLKHIGTVTSSLLCSIFFICEWATCEFRDFRTLPPHGLKFTGRKDFSQIFIALRLLKLKMSNISNSLKQKDGDMPDIFDSPGPVHDVIVCWIDQHEVHNGEGFKRLQLLIRELIQAGIFNPLAYGRQLIVSGVMDGNVTLGDLEKRKRHYKLLKQLPSSYIHDALEEAQIAEPPTVAEAMNVYSNERRLVLHRLLGDNKFTPGAKSSAKKQKYHHESGSAFPSSVDQWYFQATSNISVTDVEKDIKLEGVKASISVLLLLPLTSMSMDAGVDESQVSSKRSGGPNNRTDASEDTSGCEECRMVKRQKLSEERSSLLQCKPADEEEIWWVKKGLKYVESFKAEPPPKPAKQTTRGRQKSVRKTQSLAQLAAARIESSQGASTSHLCESRIGCPHHRTGIDDITKSVDATRKPPSGDIVSIGKLLKQMRFVEKRKVTIWLISVVKQLIEDAEKTTKVGQYNRNSIQWRLGQDELSAILYLMDVCDELVSATKFLLWLFQKIPSNPGSAIQSRNFLMLPRIVENNACDIGEAFLLSSVRRYENIIVAADLIPETLSVSMHRAATGLASKDRLSCSPAIVYARHLLKKYGNVASVIEWGKTFKSTGDKSLISEIESGRSSEGDFGFTLGVPNGVEDLDDYFRQKINGVRVSRVGLNMKEIVHRHVDEAFQYYSKDRKPYVNKTPTMEKLDDCCQISQQIVIGLIDCMRQTGGAAQEGDPSLLSSAIAAIVNNVGLFIARIPDLTASGSLHFARRILRIHITCLCILKEALGERRSRVFEVALATEASSALVQAFGPGKAPRSQFPMSPESHDFNAYLFNETSNSSNKAVLGRGARIAAAVSALVIGAILQGVSTLERMVTLFRLKEGLDLIQFARSLKSNANGNSRSMGIVKVDNLIEVSVNWFRVLVGNCRTVSDGLIVELLGETSILALFRMQRMLSSKLVFPPAYSIFAFVLWRPILDATTGIREDFHQTLAAAIGDAVKHLPFREICFRDTNGLYDLIAADTLDSEFVSMLESNSSDINLKAAALVPIRSRLFLDALTDCKMPQPIIKSDDGKSELKKRCGESVKKLMGKLVHVLDTLQPARFHWQWVELRLLLNEQAINERIENDNSLTDAIRSLSPNNDKIAASENESNFVQIILTRLLVRPDAAPLFSEAVHLLGKSLEDSMLSQAKWLLRGAEVLYGKKSIRQKVMNIASELKELSLKPQYWKPWGWCNSDVNRVTNNRDKWKSEGGALEEGEVVDEGTESNQFSKGSAILDVEGFIVSQQHLTERALIELILPCVDQGSDELRNNFASEMIKQMNNIEQHINGVTRGVGKFSAVSVPAIGSPASKSSGRKSGKSGSSAGISRQSTVSTDTVPPSPAALRASLTLRLQFILRLLPIISVDREPTGRNMRYTLASVILRLLGSRIVHEDACHFVNPATISSKRDVEFFLEISTVATLVREESLFDCLLLVLHVLLSSYQPSWLKIKSESKSTDSSKEYAVFDREVAESLQNDLDRMELPETIRWRIQTAMPILIPSHQCPISCQPPFVSPTALACLQSSTPATTLLNPSNSNPPQRSPALPGRASTSLKTKPQLLQHDPDKEIDQWTLLEDGAGSGQPSDNCAGLNGSDLANLKASNWLKGAVRVRRTDLTYIGVVDEDS